MVRLVCAWFVGFGCLVAVLTVGVSAATGRGNNMRVSASTSTAPQTPRFKVTIGATMDFTYNTYPLMGPGCGEQEARHVVIRNAKPLTLTATQLGKAQNGLFDLDATETKTLAFRETPGKCEWVFTPHVSTCGTISYTINSIGTGLGFLNRTSDQFTFFYTQIGPDPYRQGCEADGVAHPPANTTDDYPPGKYPGEPGEDGSHVSVDRAKLTAGKPFVVHWSYSGVWYQGSLHEAASWKITLIPVK